MPEIRKDPVFGRWVIVASDRSLRPNEFRNLERGIQEPSDCAFCPGNESQTPPALHVIPQENKPGAWKIRAVQNKYPALISNEPTLESADGIYHKMNGAGLHEVVIETPSHFQQMEDMDARHIKEVFEVYVSRINEMKKEAGIKYVMVFKNHGRNAGATLVHPHSQIIGMPMVPIRVVQEIDGAENYFMERNKCVFCDIADEERKTGKRIVGENREFMALEPYASRFSFETWIIPKQHSCHFETTSPESAGYLASIVKEILGKLRRSLEDLSYNLVIHTMPVHDPAVKHYHWHIEIMPKLSFVAGFEWGTGFYINAVSPEDAAHTLNSGKKYGN
ncbi:MAG: galactose-1-phosphate uridylyltransferase [Elusimicrobia bacterium]|nr:galactose-1-phosphate uridylyltransferase [Elusimicrobiota bacterium]